MTPQRLRFPFILIFLSLAGLAARLFYLQVLQGLSYYELAERQFLRKVRGESHRGEICDRNGVVLATTIESQSLYIHPKELRKFPESLNFLRNCVALDRGQLNQKLDSDQNFVWLERKMSPTIASSIAEKNLKGMGLVSEQTRYYPNGSLASHVVGTVGLDNHGLCGIEHALDSFLTGKAVVTSQLQDGKGRRILQGSPTREGNALNAGRTKSVVLTIDRTLQYVAEKEIREGVEHNQAQWGIVIIQNPQTGEILAMASYPSFDPNGFSKGKVTGIEGSVDNPAVTKMFEPGSTFKVITFAAALEEKKVELNEEIECEGGKWKFKDATINDHEGYARLSLSGVMEKSSNIGTAKIGLRLGKDILYRYARAFGFGTKTGIQLPGETAGLLRPPQIWSPVSLPIISFGQGIGVSALQMTGAFSSIANGGNLMEPILIKQLNDYRGGKLETITFEPKTVRKVISEQTASTLRKMLLAVSEKGTGLNARVPGYRVAGKTGTAQKINPQTKKYYTDRHLASFAGFLPAEDPKLVCLVILDEPKKDYWGGTTAAPIFSRVMARAVKILGIPPDQPSLLAKIPISVSQAPVKITEKKSGL